MSAELVAVERAASEAVRAVQARNRAIMDAAAAGVPLRQIADAAGLSGPGVKQIIERAGAQGRAPRS